MNTQLKAPIVNHLEVNWVNNIEALSMASQQYHGSNVIAFTITKTEYGHTLSGVIFPCDNVLDKQISFSHTMVRVKDNPILDKC